jgi:hypothetical protein
MNFVLSLLMLLCVSITSYAQTGINASPFKPEEDKRFRKLEQRVAAKFFWDFTVQGGASTAAINLRPYYSAGQLPANAIITRSYFVTNTAVIAGAGATAAFACGSATILSATAVAGNFSTAYNIYDGAQTGASTVMSKVGSSQCTPTITWAVQPATAGRIDVYLDYIKPADINGQ